MVEADRGGQSMLPSRASSRCTCQLEAREKASGEEADPGQAGLTSPRQWSIPDLLRVTDSTNDLLKAVDPHHQK